MKIDKDFDDILDYAHAFNWCPDLSLMKKIYATFDNSFAVLMPFAYAYLEELIRSTTSQYGIELLNEKGNSIKRYQSIQLIELAQKENKNNKKYVQVLDEMKKYYNVSTILDCGNNRHSVMHGYMHPRLWTKESFEELIHDIATISRILNSYNKK